MEPEKNNDSFNADELEAPEWLSSQFFEEVLSKHEESTELKVLDVKISPATSKGDHYASVMFRCKVEYTTEKGKYSKSLIVKTMPEQEGHKKEMLSNSYLFETEIGMYTKILPKFEEILREVGDNTKLYVPCIYHSLEPRQVMIFGDLVLDGYVVIRDREVTIEEAKSALSKLAKWHAISFKMLKDAPEFLKDNTHGLISLPNFLNDPFMQSGMTTFIKFLDETPELRKYKGYFESIKGSYLDAFQEIAEEYRTNRQANGYYVLSHGDFHLRNMMFKHNKTNGSFEDCMLLDFQISNICPITIDVIYSIYMLLGPEERWNHHKELVNFYFNEFIETLQKIGFKGELPNSVEFWKQISSHKFYDFFLVTTFLPMIYGMKSNMLDFNDVLQNEDLRIKMYFLKEYVEDMKRLLARYEEQGYFQ